MLAYTDFRDVFDAGVGAMVRKPGAKAARSRCSCPGEKKENGFAAIDWVVLGVAAPAPAATGDTAAAATTATSATTAEVPADQAAAQASEQPSLTGPQSTQDVGALYGSSRSG